jgi:hypothetical protein
MLVLEGCLFWRGLAGERQGRKGPVGMRVRMHVRVGGACGVGGWVVRSVARAGETQRIASKWNLEWLRPIDWDRRESSFPSPLHTCARAHTYSSTCNYAMLRPRSPMRPRPRSHVRPRPRRHLSRTPNKSCPTRLASGGPNRAWPACGGVKLMHGTVRGWVGVQAAGDGGGAALQAQGPPPPPASPAPARPQRGVAEPAVPAPAAPGPAALAPAAPAHSSSSTTTSSFAAPAALAPAAVPASSSSVFSAMSSSSSSSSANSSRSNRRPATATATSRASLPKPLPAAAAAPAPPPPPGRCTVASRSRSSSSSSSSVSTRGCAEGCAGGRAAGRARPPRTPRLGARAETLRRGVTVPMPVSGRGGSGLCVGVSAWVGLWWAWAWACR